MGTVLRVRLTGDAAERGSVPASDVARLLLGVERAVARGAGAVLGRQIPATVRWRKVIETAVRFRLVGVESGRLEDGGGNDMRTAACVLAQPEPVPVVMNDLADFQTIAGDFPLTVIHPDL